jgi:hypothetical protein
MGEETFTVNRAADPQPLGKSPNNPSLTIQGVAARSDMFRCNDVLELLVCRFQDIDDLHTTKESLAHGPAPSAALVDPSLAPIVRQLRRALP